jgi:hypothetical protein
MYRKKYPDREERDTVGFRGVSWIVNDYDRGGVVVAVEITLGAAIAGPIEIDKPALEEMVARVVARPAPTPPTSTSVH